MPFGLFPLSKRAAVTPDFHRVRLSLLYLTVGLAFQTLFYGLYICIFGYCAHVMIQKGLRGTYRITLFTILVFMFTMSSVYWIISLANVIDKINIDMVDGINRNPAYRPMLAAFIGINYCLTDAVVVWRARVLCNREYRRLLMVPYFLLFATGVSALTIIGIRCHITDRENRGKDTADLDHAIDVAQVTGSGLTLLTNISATAIIALKAWRQRILLKDFVKHSNSGSQKAERILSIIVDSGMIYIASTFLVLALALIRLPDGTLGDIYGPVNVQIAGIFPTLVFLLVSRDRGMEKSAAFSTHQSDLTARSYPLSYPPDLSGSASHSNVATVTHSTTVGGTEPPLFALEPKRRQDEFASFGHDDSINKSQMSLSNTGDEGHAFPLRYYQANQ